MQTAFSVLCSVLSVVLALSFRSIVGAPRRPVGLLETDFERDSFDHIRLLRNWQQKMFDISPFFSFSLRLLVFGFFALLRKLSAESFVQYLSDYIVCCFCPMLGPTGETISNPRTGSSGS